MKTTYFCLPGQSFSQFLAFYPAFRNARCFYLEEVEMHGFFFPFFFLLLFSHKKYPLISTVSPCMCTNHYLNVSMHRITIMTGSDQISPLFSICVSSSSSFPISFLSLCLPQRADLYLNQTVFSPIHMIMQYIMFTKCSLNTSDLLQSQNIN